MKLLQEKIAENIQTELNKTDNQTNTPQSNVISKVIYEDKLEDKSQMINSIMEKCKKKIKKSDNNIKSIENNKGKGDITMPTNKQNVSKAKENFEKTKLQKAIKSQLQSQKDVNKQDLNQMIESAVDKAIQNAMRKAQMKDNRTMANKPKSKPSRIYIHKVGETSNAKRPPRKYVYPRGVKEAYSGKKNPQVNKIRIVRAVESSKPMARPQANTPISGQNRPRPTSTSRYAKTYANAPMPRQDRPRPTVKSKYIPSPMAKTYASATLPRQNRPNVKSKYIPSKPMTRTMENTKKRIPATNSRNNIAEVVNKNKYINNIKSQLNNSYDALHDVKQLFESDTKLSVGKQPIKINNENTLNNDFFKLF